MGLPVNINDLAINLIKLSGLKPNKDIKIIYTGLRPGEKLSEELTFKQEQNSLKKTCHNKIFIASALEFDHDEFNKELDELYKLSFDSPDEVSEYLYKILFTHKNN